MKLIKVRCGDENAIPSLLDVKRDFDFAIKKFMPQFFSHGQAGADTYVKQKTVGYEFWIGDNGKPIRDIENFMKKKYPGFQRVESSTMSTTWVLPLR